MNTILSFKKAGLKARESLLRTWLKTTWGQGLQWVEPGRGSSVGLPDVLLPVGDHLMPVELKSWQSTNGKIKFKMRPAQIRFHAMSNMKYARTGVLFLLDGESIYFLPGYALPVFGKGEDWQESIKFVSQLGLSNGESKKRLTTAIRECWG